MKKTWDVSYKNNKNVEKKGEKNGRQREIRPGERRISAKGQTAEKSFLKKRKKAGNFFRGRFVHIYGHSRELCSERKQQ